MARFGNGCNALTCAALRNCRFADLDNTGGGLALASMLKSEKDLQKVPVILREMSKGLLACAILKLSIKVFWPGRILISYDKECLHGCGRYCPVASEMTLATIPTSPYYR
jgi:hypothetical protein